MLVQFAVKNFLSFYSPATLSLVCAPEVDDLQDNSVSTAHGLRLLKSLAIYGANASGKSNLISALRIASHLILESASKYNSTDELLVEPFLLRTGAAAEPSEFSFTWLDADQLFRYHFAADRRRVHRETLWRRLADRDEEELFHREDVTVRLSAAFKEGAGVQDRLANRPNALFLSLTDQLGGPIAHQVITWFDKHLVVVSGLRDQFMLGYTAGRLADGHWRSEILGLTRQADLGIAELRAKKSSKDIELSTAHVRYDAKGEPDGMVEFPFQHNSEGTQKFVAFAGPLMDVLGLGIALVIDEFDARLHPLLSRSIVELFHSPANKHNAQLIFATHDTNLLDSRLLRRDQIYFVEKDLKGDSDLYSLVNFRVEPSASYERDYIQGKYGAIPYLRPLHRMTEEDPA